MATSRGLTLLPRRIISWILLPDLRHRIILSSTTRKCKFSTDGNSSDKSADAKAGEETPSEPSRPQASEQDKKKAAAKEKLASLLSGMKITSTAADDPDSISSKLSKPEPSFVKVTVEEAKKSQGLDQQLFRAVKDVAATMAGDSAEDTEKELLNRLRLHVAEKKEGEDEMRGKPKASVNELFVGMKIDRRKPTQKRKTFGKFVEPSASEFIPTGEVDTLENIISRHQQPKVRSATLERVNIFGSEPLGIFSPQPKEQKEQPRLDTWDRLYRKELNQLVSHPPKNAYEEMILWTEQGKLWHFPINNEQGIDEEAKIGFHEHVFLEHLIEDFPKKGPVRHFMELVITGLSKNPYITVERKKYHIDWYRNYFKEKESILKATEAIQ